MIDSASCQTRIEQGLETFSPQLGGFLRMGGPEIELSVALACLQEEEVLDDRGQPQ